MARITLTGEDLAGFITKSPTDHIKLFFPEPDAEHPVMPTLGERGMVPPPPDGPQPTFRDYTVRAFRPEANALVVDFVLHGDGPAVVWATNAAPGRLVGVLGPRGSHVVPADFDWYLLAGDETALPAIGRWLEELPAGKRAMAIVEVADRSEEQQIESAGTVTITWLHRNGQPAGTTQLLEQAIRALDLPDGDGFIWAAGEADTLKPIRRYLRRELKLDPNAVDIDGYWRRGTVNLDHHAPLDDDE